MVIYLLELFRRVKTEENALIQILICNYSSLIISTLLFRQLRERELARYLFTIKSKLLHGNLPLRRFDNTLASSLAAFVRRATMRGTGPNSIDRKSSIFVN